MWGLFGCCCWRAASDAPLWRVTSERRAAAVVAHSPQPPPARVASAFWRCTATQQAATHTTTGTHLGHARLRPERGLANPARLAQLRRLLLGQRHHAQRKVGEQRRQAPPHHCVAVCAAVLRVGERRMPIDPGCVCRQETLLIRQHKTMFTYDSFCLRSTSFAAETL